MKNFNDNKPFIIASHSQGTVHAKRLISEFIDGKELQNKLIAAYLVGIKVKENEFKDIKPMNSPDETGGFVSWNSYKFNKYPKRILMRIGSEEVLHLIQLHGMTLRKQEKQIIKDFSLEI